MKKHKGQVIVEFALILPLFLLMMFGIIYSGLLFHDYSTLGNIARASAREAAITGVLQNGRYKAVEDQYEPLLDNLITGFYTKNGTDSIVIEPDGTDGVRTTITMKLNASGYIIDMIFPPTMGVQYYMRKEPTSSDSSSSDG